MVLTLFFFLIQPGVNNVLDYGLDRVTNPNEDQVNQVSPCCMRRVAPGSGGP